MCERENSFKTFNQYFEEYKITLMDDRAILHKIYDVNNNEVGRFIITIKDNDLYCISSVIIYEPYRKQGCFKAILEYTINKYGRVFLYTSNKHLIKYLDKDTRFTLDGTAPCLGNKSKIDNIYISL